MIQQILLWYSIASIVYLLIGHAFDLDSDIIMEKVGTWGFYFLSTIFLPILCLNYFYFWNFIDIKSNKVYSEKRN